VIEVPTKLVRVIIHASNDLREQQILNLALMTLSFASYAPKDTTIIMKGHRIAMNARIISTVS